MDQRLNEFGNHLEKMIKATKDEARAIREEMKQKNLRGGLYELFPCAIEFIDRIYSDVQKKFYETFPEAKK